MTVRTGKVNKVRENPEYRKPILLIREIQRKELIFLKKNSFCGYLWLKCKSEWNAPNRIEIERLHHVDTLYMMVCRWECGEKSFGDITRRATQERGKHEDRDNIQSVMHLLFGIIFCYIFFFLSKKKWIFRFWN